MVRPFRARGAHSSMHSCAQLCLCHAVPEWLVPIGIKMCGRSRGWGQLSNDLCQGAIHAENGFSWFNWFLIGISKFYEKSSNVCLVIWGSDSQVHIKSLCRDGQCAGLRGWVHGSSLSLAAGFLGRQLAFYSMSFNRFFDHSWSLIIFHKKDRLLGFAGPMER